MIDSQINNGGEQDLDRGEVVWNNRGSSMVFDITLFMERFHMSHFSILLNHVVC